MAEGLHRNESKIDPYQALHTQDQRQGQALWPPADCVNIQTLCREWAYGMAFQTSEERKRWLPRYLRLYNDRRCHLALGGLSPQQRPVGLFAE
jgi:transposase InsO family protein